ncbi:glycine zipper 2TM domain-containing protein [Herbaspirillum sp. HC18]|nr:glycine zipper 2TM domain-containing protein [Herbaspirillum sp. HC18]
MHMWSNKTNLSLIAVYLVVLAACGTPQGTTSSVGTAPVATTTTTTSAANLNGYGVIQAIDVIPREQASGIGLGTVAGAVVGGVLGNQIGSGTGRTAATVAGAAGGAYVGNRMSQNSAANAGQVYRVAVRMDNGSVQTFAQEAAPAVQVGDRVRLENGVIVERFR